MEFLLINHPLDCPICDQGGECQLQDLAVGYGASASRYEEEKRVVLHKDVGPLISMEEMSRCIHCTRCVRFGQEMAGVMELGMVHRGEHAEITTVLGDTVDSEVSGNMIDLCPVGALTSKPFRYSARTWELSRRKSVSPHDSTGANLIVQVKNNRVMRVLPLENEAVNECWLADRDRFSYEALNGEDRLTAPMLKQGGEWKTVDWQTALEYVANGLKHVTADHGAKAIGAAGQPAQHGGGAVPGRPAGARRWAARTSTTACATREFAPAEGVRWLGTSIASLSELQRVLVVGSNLRKDHPLFAMRIRFAARHGAQVSRIHDVDARLGDGHGHHGDGARRPVGAGTGRCRQPRSRPRRACPRRRRATPPTRPRPSPPRCCPASARPSCWATPPRTTPMRPRCWRWRNGSARQTGATVGYLTEAANTVGAQLAGALPGEGGLNAGQMLAPGGLKAAILLNNEPEFDSAAGTRAAAALGQAEMVVTLSPFKANMDFSDVLLPIAPWTETPGTFVNAEGRVQSFHAVVKPLGETRPGWKVLRVLGNLLGLQGFEFESAQEVLAAARGEADAAQAMVQGDLLSNRTTGAIDVALPAQAPASAAIYQLDGIVRRAASLQLTADGQAALPAAQRVVLGRGEEALA